MSWLVATLAGALAVAAVILSVTRPNVVHALLWLVAALVAIAAAFFALGAAFAGAVQILIYAGAVVAVFVFVVMTVDTSGPALARERAALARAWKAPAALAALAVLPVLAAALLEGPTAAAPVAIGPAALGGLLFGPWAVAVELVSILLLAGLLGVRHVGRRLGPMADEGDRP
jgi:NADH-quinone oxidoreductase subunit J